MCIEGRTNSAPLKGAQLNAAHDHFLPCSDWFGFSPRRERTRRFTVGSHRERVQNEDLSSGRHKRYIARRAHVKRIQALREALEDFCQQWRSLVATAVSFQLASQARGGAQLQRP